MTASLPARVMGRLERRLPPGAPRPRVLILRGLGPPLAAGALAADCVALAGGEPFRAAPGDSTPNSTPPPKDGDEGHAPSWEEVLEFDPQLVLLSLDGPGRAGALAAWNSIEGWNRVEAAERGRVVLAKPGLCLPGPDLAGDLFILQNLMGFHFWGWPEGGPDQSA